MVVRRPAALLVALATGPAVLAGCARGDGGPAEVRVVVGPQDLAVRPVQLCDDGERRRYDVSPPILEVSPDAPISLTVPDSVAERGWSVQVFDEQLAERIGDVDVPEGEDVFTEINTSDVVPPAFYLVVVEDKGGECGEWSGAWPIGFIRAGGDVGTTAPSSTPATPSP